MWYEHRKKDLNRNVTAIVVVYSSMGIEKVENDTTNGISGLTLVAKLCFSINPSSPMSLLDMGELG